jgi:hypothetical protein
LNEAESVREMIHNKPCHLILWVGNVAEVKMSLG